MKATVLDESGKASRNWMGCYGIGVSRIVAAAIEQSHDEKGISLAKAMAPFQVSFIAINMFKSEAVRNLAEKLYQELNTANIEVLFDDRDERAGVMFADNELLGIPHRIVIGEKNLAQNKVEYKSRQGTESQLIPITEALHFIQSII